LVIPAFVVLLSRWTPPDKTASMTAFAFAGNVLQRPVRRADWLYQRRGTESPRSPGHKWVGSSRVTCQCHSVTRISTDFIANVLWLLLGEKSENTCGILCSVVCMFTYLPCLQSDIPVNCYFQLSVTLLFSDCVNLTYQFPLTRA